MAFNFLNTLDADDIFISYSRSDGSPYLTGLDAALSKQGFSCFTDKRGTDAGRLPPETLFRKIRLCKTLVLLGTPGAVASPENITPELKEFADANGTSRIVSVSFDRGAEFAAFSEAWLPFVEGKAREREDPDALTTGKPSDMVVEAVAKASDYMKSKDRLLKYRRRALRTLAGLLFAIIAAAVLAVFMFYRAAAATKWAEAETERAAQATRAAVSALAQAVAAQADALTATTSAEVAKADATEQKRLAKEASDDAKEQARLAGEAAGKARAAEARATAEQARADREGALADLRSLANRSQSVLRRSPENVAEAVWLANESMKKSVSLSFHALEADTALRESLALLPSRRSSDRYPLGSYKGVDRNSFALALSPDGRHIAVGGPNNRLLIYGHGRRAPLYTLDCKCTDAPAGRCRLVTLSSGPDYAAAVIDDRGLKFFDLRDDSRSRCFKLGNDGKPWAIALSPGGQYLALHDVTTRSSNKSRLFVRETERGEVVKSFENYSGPPAASAEAGALHGLHPPGRLGLHIINVGFGPSGNLAVVGLPTVDNREGLNGRVILWPLRLAKDGEKGERTLGEDSFSKQYDIPLNEWPDLVVPGADETTFATRNDVWKRMPGRADFERVAHLPNSASVLAFNPDGKKLSLARVHVDGGLNGAPGLAEVEFEEWDAAGHQVVSETSQPLGVGAGFKPHSHHLTAVTFSPPKGKPPVSTFDAGSGELLNAGGNAAEARPDWLSEKDGKIIFTSQDGHWVVRAKDGVAAVWDTWENKRREVQYGPALRDVGYGWNSEENFGAVSSDGGFFALAGRANDDHGKTAIFIYRTYGGDTFTEWKRLLSKDLGLISGNELAFDLHLSGGGQVLASRFLPQRGRQRFVRVFNVKTWLDITPNGLKDGSGDSDMRIYLSPDGRYLATGPTNRLYDLSTGHVDTPRLDHWANKVAFSPDGKHIGLGTMTGLLYVFETGRMDEPITRLQHPREVTSIAFSDDGMYVASESPEYPDKGMVSLRVWHLQPAKLIEEAETRMKAVRRPER